MRRSLLLLGALAAPAQNPFGPGVAKAAPAPPTSPPATLPRSAASAPSSQAPAAPAHLGQAPRAPAAGVIYHTAIAPEYANQPASSACQHTCLDQYNTDKAARGASNSGLNWIDKGGGYYSECDERLKGRPIRR